MSPYFLKSPSENTANLTSSSGILKNFSFNLNCASNFPCGLFNYAVISAFPVLFLSLGTLKKTYTGLNGLDESSIRLGKSIELSSGLNLFFSQVSLSFLRMESAW